MQAVQIVWKKLQRLVHPLVHGVLSIPWSYRSIYLLYPITIKTPQPHSVPPSPSAFEPDLVSGQEVFRKR